MALQSKATGRHKLLDVDGIAAPGEIASPGEILINKLVPMSTKDPLPPNTTSMPLSNYKPAPVSWKGPPGESCIVDKVLLTQNDDGHNVIKASTLCLPLLVLKTRSDSCWLAQVLRINAGSKTADGPSWDVSLLHLWPSCFATAELLCLRLDSWRNKC